MVTLTRAVTFIAVLGIIAALYVAKAIFIPLALAILLTFLLAPAVRLLRGWEVPRPVAVVVVVVIAFSIILGIGGLFGQQVTQLAERLPQYQYNIVDKIQHARSALFSGGTLERLSRFLSELNQQIAPEKAQTQPNADGEKPAKVEMVQPPARPAEVLQSIVQPLIDPLTTVGLIIIFVVFFLLQREDLRDRMIRLAGSHDLQRTTQALNDGARRLSHYFIAQTALNASFGVIVGTALTFIGVPNPVLWGIMGMVLRFVPYIGAWLAAAFPIALSVAVDPGWSMTLWTIALYAVVEPLIGQVIEPLVFGRTTGLTPVAVIISATFWTWLWGPVGLLLSTPLAVCLGVLGRHIESLRFLEVMIGDDAPLSPAQSFYQRALAGEPDESVQQVEDTLKECKLLTRCYDDVVLQGLLLAQIDLRRDALDEEHISRINEVVQSLIVELADVEEDEEKPRARRKEKNKDVEKNGGERRERSEEKAPRKLSPEQLPPEWRSGKPVLCVGGRGPFDDCAAALLAQLLEKHGLPARFESNNSITALNIEHLDADAVKLVCLSTFDLAPGSAQPRYAIRRLHRRIANARVLACLWGTPEEGVPMDELKMAGADACASTFAQAVDYCLTAVQSEAQPSAAPAHKSDAA
jgi:predicted PurR-regulated permease PerM